MLSGTTLKRLIVAVILPLGVLVSSSFISEGELAGRTPHAFAAEGRQTAALLEGLMSRGESAQVGIEPAEQPTNVQPPNDASAMCFGKAATIVGTDGDDILTGSNGIDVISGLGGSDYIDGWHGADLICGGPGDDFLFGGNGPDQIAGDDGDDTIAGEYGADSLLGGVGDYDGILGGAGADFIDGGPGVGDFASYFQAPAGVRADLTTGRVSGGDGADRLAGIEMLQGSPHNDVLIGDDQTNVLVGAFGPDGNDVLDGGGALDIAAFFFSDHAIHGNLATKSAIGQGADALLEVESIAGSDLNDSLAGDGGANWLFGGAGADELAGIGGNDFLDGETGNDHLLGGEGEDSLVGGQGDDALDGGAGSFDSANYASSPAPIVLDIGAGYGSGWGTDSLSDLESAVGSRFGDDLRGDGEVNVLDGGAGDDSLTGLGGSDYLTGGDGNDQVSGGLNDDTLLGDTGANALDGGDGVDDCFDSAAAANCETGQGGGPTSLLFEPPLTDSPPAQQAQPDTLQADFDQKPQATTTLAALASGTGTVTDLRVNGSARSVCQAGAIPRISTYGPGYADPTNHSGLAELVYWRYFLQKYNFTIGRWVYVRDSHGNYLVTGWEDDLLYDWGTVGSWGAAGGAFDILVRDAYRVVGEFWWENRQGSAMYLVGYDQGGKPTTFCDFR